MLMWGASASARLAEEGFTLLEMMVVMVLLGLLGSLTLPSLQRWQTALTGRAEAGLVIEALRSQAFQAGARRMDLLLNEASFSSKSGIKGLASVQLPPGWSVRRVRPARFLSNGLCDPGVVAFSSASGLPLLIHIKGPICQFEWQTDPAAS
ncbi:prepilin-type N-terminal cleavage/methylation domain-containing protein [Inhella inkyongensis]|uniref:Prepilin-type N-terminal cleavage/methylation domain-containing protein n=1 Tax=Inhella inkyongensis TaxID=392593 RepID=A0A840S657_9BURK|nr:type II secretion system protein [Inhella inkyongensis]MBB5204486.1 prepilin-type N-terminal cleavage/methylation domain-containing protein [Inhella inkyongensis]